MLIVETGCYPKGGVITSAFHARAEFDGDSAEDEAAFSKNGRITGSSKSSKVRKLFPQTWLWTSGDTKSVNTVG